MMHANDHNPPDQRFGTSTSRRQALATLLGGAGLLVLGHPAIAQTPQSARPSPAGTRIPLRDALADLTPRAVWEGFSQLTQIPRPSHYEAQVSAFLAQFGRGLGLDTTADDVGNVLIRKPASSGMEDRAGLILQAHMDMVPAKTSDSDHTFETDPIDAFVEDGWVRADRTTLGADDGIGIALIMALLQNESLIHGPLEALFTVNEEDGFTGANAVRPGVLRGSLLMNVDSEEEGTFTIGSAGGVDLDATASYVEESPPAGSAGVRLEIVGLQGGHSGMDINRGRGNAITLLARLLGSAREEVDLRVASITGGDRYNAIPREAAAVVAVPAADVTSLTAYAEGFAATVKRELTATEPDLEVTATPAALPLQVMTQDAQRRIVDGLYGVANGVMRMSDQVPGLVETSTNLGTVKAEDGTFAAGFLIRSAVDSERDAVVQMIERVFALAEIDTTAHDAYSGWTPNAASPLLALMQTVYRQRFGQEAAVMAVHAGLETSVFGAKYPGLDMISVGPTIENVHSPREQLEIASVGKVHDLLIATLEQIPAAPTTADSWCVCPA